MHAAALAQLQRNQQYGREHPPQSEGRAAVSDTLKYKYTVQPSAHSALSHDQAEQLVTRQFEKNRQVSAERAAVVDRATAAGDLRARHSDNLDAAAAAASGPQRVSAVHMSQQLNEVGQAIESLEASFLFLFSFSVR